VKLFGPVDLVPHHTDRSFACIQFLISIAHMRPNSLGAQTFRADVATNMTLHDLGKGLICLGLYRYHVLPSLVCPLASKMGKHASNELRERLMDMVYDKRSQGCRSSFGTEPQDGP